MLGYEYRVQIWDELGLIIMVFWTITILKEDFEFEEAVPMLQSELLAHSKIKLRSY